MGAEQEFASRDTGCAPVVGERVVAIGRRGPEAPDPTSYRCSRAALRRDRGGMRLAAVPRAEPRDGSPARSSGLPSPAWGILGRDRRCTLVARSRGRRFARPGSRSGSDARGDAHVQRCRRAGGGGCARLDGLASRSRSGELPSRHGKARARREAACASSVPATRLALGARSCCQPALRRDHRRRAAREHRVALGSGASGPRRARSRRARSPTTAAQSIAKSEFCSAPISWIGHCIQRSAARESDRAGRRALAVVLSSAGGAVLPVPRSSSR